MKWKRIRDTLQGLRTARAWSDGRSFRHAVKKVILVSSSSRGGSSVFTEYLRSSRSMLHLRGELNAFLVLHGLGHPDSGTGSDALDARHVDARADAFAEELELDLGRPVPVKDVTRAHFERELHYRLRLQWPFIDLDPDVLDDAFRSSTAPLGSDAFHAALLVRLHAASLPIHPGYYDLSPSLLRTVAPTLGPCAGPPGPAVLEEPPFVCISPWEPTQQADLERLPVVLKTPSNAHRLPFFQALFPNARLKVLHLTRNPAASINGLFDGWLYPRGFFSHDVGSVLGVQGYTGTAPWADRWWNFDLPPGWEGVVGRPLEEVAAFQWLAAHEATLRFRSALDTLDYRQVAFEDVLGPRARPVLDDLFRWMEIEPDAPLLDRTVTEMPHVMATDQPRARRWFDRQALIEPILKREEIVETARQLGYGGDSSTWE